jgi:molybdate transport system regulatory protein
MDDYSLKVKLYLEDSQEKFMGIGVLWLLQKIEECGSLRAAALDLGISYSKAFKMIENLEASLGQPVLERKRGGSNRIGASLTPFGLQFVALYDNFQKQCKALLKEPFDDFMKNLSKLKQEFGKKD